VFYGPWSTFGESEQSSSPQVHNHEVKRAPVQDIGEASAHNKRILHRKAQAILAALPAVGVEDGIAAQMVTVGQGLF
jgi:hypothetical protein